VLAPRTLAELVDADRLATLGVALDASALTDGTTSWSWGEYVDLVARTAGALAGAGVEHGDRVGVHLTKSVHSFVAVHAVLRAGAVMVPVDPLAPVDLAAAVLADAGVEVVISDARPAVLEPLVERVAPSVLVLPRTATAPGVATGAAVVVTADAIDAAEPAGVPVLDPHDPAYIIYTSGSTGRPKGIVHTHRSALTYAVAGAEAYELDAADRMVNIAPLHFDQSTFELYSAPLAGAAVIVVSDPVLRFPASVASLVEAERATVWYSVPHLLVQMVARGALADRDLSSLRWILFGGEAFPPRQLAELMGLVPSARLSNVYGPAEVNQCTRYDLDAPPSTDDPVPIGRAWPAARLRVVDTEAPRDPAREVPSGEPGVLLVASDTMMEGYWRRDDLTAASIVHDDDGVRWYVTGDLVVENETGDLVFLGRVDNQVKLRGHRIELEAIDAVLAEVDGVEAATAVVVRPADAEDVLVALVVAAGDTAAVAERARAVLRARLPRYAVPAEVRVVDELPRTSSGKVDRGASAGLATA
jgi:amino acid adenylation domain-containing protein